MDETQPVEVTDLDRANISAMVEHEKARRELRDRIAEALYSHTGMATSYVDLDQDQRDAYLARADSILPVLPAPADRAAVLAEALTAAEAVNARYPYGCSAAAVIEELRRMADEAQEVDDGS